MLKCLQCSLTHHSPPPHPKTITFHFKVRNEQWHYQVRYRSESIGDDTVPTPLSKSATTSNRPLPLSGPRWLLFILASPTASESE